MVAGGHAPRLISNARLAGSAPASCSRVSPIGVMRWGKGAASVGGSFQPDNVAEYDLMPWDLDYGRVVRFELSGLFRE